ncbi:MAG: peptidase T [Treponema sp.]
MAGIEKKSDFQKKLLNRFLKYTKIWTTSDSANADAQIFPSTENQQIFAQNLKEELSSLGLENVQVTEKSYVYAILKATEGFENSPSFCLLSHLDTSEEVSGKNVNTQVFENYDGSLISLENISIDSSGDEELSKIANTGDTLITTDGTTLLGADDKAGVAEIITAVEFLIQNKIPHGDIEILFSPDEETGHGMDFVPLNLLKSKHAYTVDGGSQGELETECFNASSATVTFFGKSTHTGTARKQKMINAVMMASKFLENLPHTEFPETTDGYEGFFAPIEISGSVEKAQVYILLRDFEESGIEKRIFQIKKIAESVEFATGGKVSVQIKEQYKNMKNALEKSPETVELLKKAYENAGITPDFIPIRGGTDGSKLSEMGIPTPNIFTGGHNFHSRFEWASLNQMTQAVNVLINLAILHQKL